MNEASRWRFADVASETLMAESADSIPWPPALNGLADAVRPGQTIAYGWPAVIVEYDGRLRVGPLFTAPLDIAQRGVNRVALADSPVLNHALLDTRLFAAEDIAAAEAMIPDQLPAEPAALARLAREIVDILGLDVIETLSGRQLRIPTRPGVGVHNSVLLVIGEETSFTASLIDELRELEDREDWRDTAAGWLAGAPVRDHVAPDQWPTAAPLALNDSQEQAASRIRSDSLTVVTGPPGTGKSQLVVAAVANAILDGETVLVASHNNAAVEVAVERASEVDRAALVRTGNRDMRERLTQQLPTLLARDETRQDDEAAARQRLSESVMKRRQLHAAIERRAALDTDLLDLYVAIERGSERTWALPVSPLEGTAAADARRCALRLAKARLFAAFRGRRLLQRVGAIGTSAPSDLIDWATASARAATVQRERDGLRELIGDDTIALREVDAEWVAASLAATRCAIRGRIARNRASLNGLGTAANGGPAFARAMEQALVAVRGIACTTLPIARNLPLKAAMIDLVVLDEASQCSLAAALPVLYRAKRAAIVGDPNQLNPIVHLGRAELESIARSCGYEDLGALDISGIAYGTGSAFLAYQNLSGPANVVLLDQHYRCHPLIARWFNAFFYGGNLRVLTDVGEMDGERRGLEWVDVDESRTERGPMNRSVVNRVEAALVVDAIAPLIEGQVSLGVVSPFAAQADLIKRMAIERYGNEMLHDVDFESATANRFQGGERDVMLFSTTIAPNTSPKTAKWVEATRNLLNVAASRGRRALIVFGHPTAARTLGVPTLASLRDAVVNGIQDPEPSWLVHSDAERRLLDAMHKCGLAPVLKPVVEGYELDFALRGSDGQYVNVEVDGPHHDERGRLRRADVARDRLLRALGYEVIRVPAWRCYSQPGRVASEIAAVMSLRRDSADQAGELVW